MEQHICLARNSGCSDIPTIESANICGRCASVYIYIHKLSTSACFLLSLFIYFLNWVMSQGPFSKVLMRDQVCGSTEATGTCPWTVPHGEAFLSDVGR